jgi:hypothetical protein
VGCINARTAFRNLILTVFLTTMDESNDDGSWWSNLLADSIADLINKRNSRIIGREKRIALNKGCYFKHG